MAPRPSPYFELTFWKRRPRVSEHRLSASRPLVVLSCLYQQGTRCSQPDHVFQVSKPQDAGHPECHLDAGISGEGIPIVYASAIRDGCANPFIECAGPDRHPPAVGVADEPYAARVDLGSCREVIERDANIMENLSQQSLSTDEATCQLIIFGMPCNRAPVPFLERESVRCDDDVAALSKLRTIGLIRITGEADDLTLAEIELSGMLMMSNYSWDRPAGIFWKKDKRLYALPFFYGVLNGLANVRATVNIAQYYWVQRTARRTWPDQLSEADSIHAWIVGSADRIVNWRK
jgi:hypothetical protein